MSIVKDQTDKIAAALTDIGTKADAVATEVATLTANVAALTAQLAANTGLSDDDKAALQAVVDQSGVVQGKVDALVPPAA